MALSLGYQSRRMFTVIGYKVIAFAKGATSGKTEKAGSSGD